VSLTLMRVLTKTLAAANLSASHGRNVNLLSSVARGIWLPAGKANGATKMHRIALSVGVLHSLNHPLVTTARLVGRTV